MNLVVLCAPKLVGPIMLLEVPNITGSVKCYS